MSSRECNDSDDVDSVDEEDDRRRRRKEFDRTYRRRETAEEDQRGRTQSRRRSTSPDRGKKRRTRDDDDDDRKRSKQRRKRFSGDEDETKWSNYRKGKSQEKSKEERMRKSKRKAKNSKKRNSRASSTSESFSSKTNSVSSSDESERETKKPKHSSTKVINARLLQKLASRSETLEEREARRAERRAARIAAKFGYTADDNPFNDPNIHETFSWKKKEEKTSSSTAEKATAPKSGKPSRHSNQEKIFEEIEKVRKRRQDRELHFEEIERIRAEESRMKESENYDEWARKEEEFHLQQQRQRSAIRLVEGREKPVDVLAKNLLLFGLTEEEKHNRAAVKYQEKYNALDELETLEAELDEPHLFLRNLKQNELEELLLDIDAYRTLEREAAEQGGTKMIDKDDNPVIRYWDALHLVTSDEIEYVKTGGRGGMHANLVEDIQKLFEGQSTEELNKMKDEINAKLRSNLSGLTSDSYGGGVIDSEYWQAVLKQLVVDLAKVELSDIHSKMLVRQLEKLERRKEFLTKATATDSGQSPVGGRDGNRDGDDLVVERETDEAAKAIVPMGVAHDFGTLDEELGLSSEVNLGTMSYAWQERYRPRKPRYFNRVKTGYDWNKYNQTHYDHDNPPPKTVQGYKFNIFYPDLIDKATTPQYLLEPADSNEFCIIRFHAGPPYEDVAFKIINREWNRSRKRGFRCTFERGVLSLYFNFASHWYRR